MLKLSKGVLLVSLAICCCTSGCTPEKEIGDSLVQSVEPVVVSVPVLAEFVLDRDAYSGAIVDQENIIFQAEDSLLKRNAYLALVALHMSRLNPKQDFMAASAALDHAVEFDSSLVNDISIQRWLDIFTLLRKMSGKQGIVGQLQEDNQALRVLIEKQKKSIDYFEKTLNKLQNVEIDVEKKKRLYR